MYHAIIRIVFYKIFFIDILFGQILVSENTMFVNVEKLRFSKVVVLKFESVVFRKINDIYTEINNNRKYISKYVHMYRKRH